MASSLFRPESLVTEMALAGARALPALAMLSLLSFLRIGVAVSATTANVETPDDGRAHAPLLVRAFAVSSPTTVTAYALRLLADVPAPMLDLDVTLDLRRR